MMLDPGCAMHVLLAAMACALLVALVPWGGRGSGHMGVCLVVRDGAERLEGEVREAFGWLHRLGVRGAGFVVVDRAAATETHALLAALTREYPGLTILREPDDTGGEGAGMEGIFRLCDAPWVLVRVVAAPRCVADGLPAEG